jgi:hypothetical protein
MPQALLLVASAAWEQLEAAEAVPLQALLSLVPAADSRAVAQMLCALAYPEPAVEVAGRRV